MTALDIRGRVLDNLHDGVMVVGAGGEIVMFNPAAGRILGLPPEAAAGKTFAELFIARPGFDAFTGLILDAVGGAGLDGREVVAVEADGAARSLSVAVSYLRTARDCGGGTAAVIAVFSDITELRELRESELRMAKAAEAQHGELREAYREIEARTETLAATLKKVQTTRVLATVLVFGVFVAAGLYTWYGNPFATALAPAAAVRSSPDDLSTVVVEPRRLVSTITVAGRVAPRRQIRVVSPIDGTVAAVHFQYGELVAEGQPLLDLDVSKVRIEQREAQAAFLKADERSKDYADWTNNVEVAKARRSVSKARTELEDRKSKLDETAFLLDKGVIPASEHAAARRRHRSQALDLEAAEKNLESVLAKGDAEGRVALLELANARARLAAFDETMRKSEVRAPVAGVIMEPERGGGASQGKEGRRLARGTSVRTGERLLTIGDLDGLSVVGVVDEVDIVRIERGDPVRIAGDAFPGVELRGRIVHVSSQASDDGKKGKLPSFKVVAVVEELSAAQHRSLRLGMSANLEVTVYDREDALLVPIGAVEVRDGAARLRIKDGGAVRHVEVVTGVTTLDAVEIVEGIEAGDEIVVPRQ